MDASRTPSLLFDLGSIALEPTSKLYLTLGLKESNKQNPGNPKVLALVSSVFEKSVLKNEIWLEATQTKDVLTIFHGSRAPTLTIQQYLERIFKYSHCSPSCFVVAQIYIDRFVQRRKVNLTLLSVHRLLITSIMVAAKFIDDAFFNNAYYAKVGGVTTEELNRLEMEFLFGLDFRLHVSLSTFENYCSQLTKEVQVPVDVRIERPQRAMRAVCGMKETWSNNDDESSCYPPMEIHIK